jgi:hypothetical protein
VPPAETFMPLAETIVHTSEAAVKSAAVKPAETATVKPAAPAMPSVGEI